MKNRIKLRKKTKKSKLKTVFIIYIVVFLFVMLLLIYLGKNINGNLLKYAEIEASKISKLIVNDAVSRCISNKFDNDKLFDIQKDTLGNIQAINFNTYYVNSILSDITKNIMDTFNGLEKGDLNMSDISNNLNNSKYIEVGEKGIIMKIPMGVITNNAFLNNLGPRIPIRLLLNGELESNISTKVENYGINNALVNIYANINVSEQMILPISSKRITVSNSIPIALKMVQGTVPKYYSNGTGENYNGFSVSLP